MKNSIAFNGTSEVMLSPAIISSMGVRQAINLLEPTLEYLAKIKETPDLTRPILKVLVTGARDQLVQVIQSKIGEDTVAMLIAQKDLEIQLANQKRNTIC